MHRPLSAVVLFVAGAALHAAPVPNFPRDPSLDRDGNKLPLGATARLGSLAFRARGAWGATFSADGTRLMTLSDGELLTWDAESGRVLERKSFAPNAVDRSAFVVGDRVFWITSEPNVPPNVIVADLRDGKRRSRFVPAVEEDWIRGFRHIEVSSDAKYFAVVVQKASELVVVDAETGRVVHARKVAKPGDTKVHITPDSTTLYVVEEDQPLRRYSLTAGKELDRPAEGEKVPGTIRVAPDGKRAVTGGLSVWERSTAGSTLVMKGAEEHLTVRRADTGKALGRLELGRPLSDVRFIGSDALLVSSWEWGRKGAVECYLARWDLRVLKREWEVPCPRDERLVVSPDGNRVAVAGTHSVWVYDAKTGKRTDGATGHDAPVAWVGISADGRTITTVGDPADRRVAVWTERGERKSHTELPELRGGRVAGHPAGDHLVWTISAVTKAEVPGWLLDTGVEEVIGWDRQKNAVAWRFAPEIDPQEVYTHDGKRVVTVCRNKVQKRWDAVVYDGPTGKRLGAWPLPHTPEEGPGGVRDERPLTAPSGDGKLLFVASENVVGANASTGRVEVQFETGRIGRSDSMASSSDGSRLAVTREGRRPRDLLIFDVKSGKELARHEIGCDFPNCKFGPDGTRVAVWSGFGGTGVTVYGVRTDAKPLVLDGGLSAPTAVAFHPNGKSVVVGYADGTSLVWDLTAK
ncbi:MAG: PQQ-binding-like beta-propeller repeat protein [Planctomycetes bacterium]|nr:PQQ-binding-like beta-propeller repeat protein [Planctomycetota bacterium]